MVTEETGSIRVLVPVAPHEPLNVIENSVESLSDLEEPENFDLEFYYLIDCYEDEEQKIDKIESLEEDMNVVTGKPGSGGKAKALNKGLEIEGEPDYVVVFDVDSRPETDYITSCLEPLEEKDDVFMVSGRREIINSDFNLITKVSEVEFTFYEDIQTFFDYTRAFNHFNGPIAVIDGEFALETGFNEEVICEDTYFTETGYLNGKRAILQRETAVNEQAPAALNDLFSQKVRWMKGAVEGLHNFFLPLMSSDNSLWVKMSWLSAMTVPFLAFLLSPLAIFFGIRMYLKNSSIKGAFKSSLAAFLYTWFVTFCGLIVIKNSVLGNDIKWKKTQRQDL